MPMQNLERAVRSIPMPVRFAGFESDTLKLAQAGWDLSMRQIMDMRMHPEIQLALNFDCSGGSYRAVSNPLPLDYATIMRVKANGLIPNQTLERMAYGFDIMYIGAGDGCRFRTYPRSGSLNFASSFHPVDPVPQEVEESLADFKFFKVASKPSVKDLIVAPSDVPELLDAVMRAQKPLMEKIKARERSRENMEHMRNGFRPRTEVAMQVLALAE